MKFPQLPIGARFRWQGELYRKTGPMTAHAETEAGQKLIPRSAVVEPLQDGPAKPPAAGASFTADEVQAALHALVERLRAYAQTLDGPDRAALEAHLEDAARGFRAALGL